MVFRKRRGVNKKKSVSAVATKAANRAINRRAELKNFAANFSLTVSNTPLIGRLSLVAQNTTDITRIGDELEMKNLSLGYQITYSDTTNILRITVIQMLNATIPVESEIFQDTSTIGLLLGGFAQDYRRSNQFKVLYDKIYNVNANKLNLVGRVVLRNFRTKKIGFLSASTNGSGHLYYIVTSDSTAIGHPTVQLASQLAYYDF